MAHTSGFLGLIWRFECRHWVLLSKDCPDDTFREADSFSATLFSTCCVRTASDSKWRQSDLTPSREFIVMTRSVEGSDHAGSTPPTCCEYPLF